MPRTEQLLVIDSSAALRAAQSTAARRQLVDHRLVAPPLLWSEVTSALHEAQWRRQVDDAATAVLRRTISEMGIARRDPDRLHDVAWEIADELGWAKTYDAEFLALASLEGGVVLTTDGRMRRGADRTGLVIDPSQLP